MHTVSINPLFCMTWDKELRRVIQYHRAAVCHSVSAHQHQVAALCHPHQIAATCHPVCHPVSSRSVLSRRRGRRRRTVSTSPSTSTNSPTTYFGSWRCYPSCSYPSMHWAMGDVSPSINQPQHITQCPPSPTQNLLHFLSLSQHITQYPPAGRAGGDLREQALALEPVDARRLPPPKARISGAECVLVCVCLCLCLCLCVCEKGGLCPLRYLGTTGSTILTTSTV